jgi:thioredoxin-like negative regulator of GroEL
MKPLISHVEFEQLIGLQQPDPGVKLPFFTVIYFTAGWCGACRSLDLDAIEKAVPGANWLKCDIDQNDYTPGYCGVRSIPTFLIVHNKKVVGTLTSNNTQKVIEWVSPIVLLAWLNNPAAAGAAAEK